MVVARRCCALVVLSHWLRKRLGAISSQALRISISRSASLTRLSAMPIQLRVRPSACNKAGVAHQGRRRCACTWTPVITEVCEARSVPGLLASGQCRPRHCAWRAAGSPDVVVRAYCLPCAERSKKARATPVSSWKAQAPVEPNTDHFWLRSTPTRRVMNHPSTSQAQPRQSEIAA